MYNTPYQTKELKLGYKASSLQHDHLGHMKEYQLASVEQRLNEIEEKLVVNALKKMNQLFKK